MIYKDIKLLLTPEARYHLHLLFDATPTRISEFRRSKRAFYDGHLMTIAPEYDLINRQGMSHSLNLIALHYTLAQFTDNRTDFQTQQCQRQQHPTPDHFDYTSHQSVNEYKQNYALPNYKALWSNMQLHEYSDPLPDSDDEPILEYTRREVSLKLSPGAISFYYRLATKYNMQPILYQPNPFPPKGRKPRCGVSNYVSAALEAIGCRWLLPPDGYRELIDENRNQNKNHVNTRKPAHNAVNSNTAIQGNHAHAPLLIDLKDSRWQPFTHERMLELRAEMIKNGEIIE